MSSERNDCCSILALNLDPIRALLNNVQFKVVKKSPVHYTHSVIVIVNVLVSMKYLPVEVLETGSVGHYVLSPKGGGSIPLFSRCRWFIHPVSVTPKSGRHTREVQAFSSLVVVYPPGFGVVQIWSSHPGSTNAPPRRLEFGDPGNDI
jgi:hypothetical protein